MALKTMGHVQQLDLDSCDWMAYDGLEDVLEELVHSLYYRTWQIWGSA